MNLRDRALSKYKQKKTPENWEQYRQLRNYVSIAVESEKKAYVDSRFRVNSSKENWKLLRDLKVYSRAPKSIPEHLGSAEDINRFFISAVQSINPDPTTLNYYVQNKKRDVGFFEFRLATADEIERTLFSIKSQAVGVDGIGLSMLLLCCPHIVPFIVHLVNCCIETSVFPAAWKNSFLLPIPKVQPPSELKDLRPISILPTLSKIIEKVLENQIREYVESYKLLPSIQSGFRKGYSCATALLKVTDDILEAADRGELTALILLDYSKAFDKLNHQLLLAILDHLGFGNKACRLIKDYLTGRTQSVKLQNTESSRMEVACGVPQGSILGPLFFTLYTSQLINNLQFTTAHLYADDTQIYLSFKPETILEANEKLTSDLNALLKASQNHCLELNPKKCQALLFGRTQSRDQYQNALRVNLNNEVLDCSKTVARNLGVLLDVQLRFSDHVNNCIKKAFSSLRRIYSQRHILNANIKKMLCDSLVLSQFTFCDVLYGPCLLERDARRIQLIQNCCVRLIGGIRKYDRGVTAKLREIEWLNMSERRFLNSLVLYNKIIFKKCPDYLYQKIKFRYDVHDLDLRHKHIITPPLHKTASYERSFSYQSSVHYNKVPPHLKTVSLNKFKYTIRQLIFNNILT